MCGQLAEEQGQTAVDKAALGQQCSITADSAAVGKQLQYRAGRGWADLRNTASSVKDPDAGAAEEERSR